MLLLDTILLLMTTWIPIAGAEMISGMPRPSSTGQSTKYDKIKVMEPNALVKALILAAELMKEGGHNLELVEKQ